MRPQITICFNWPFPSLHVNNGHVIFKCTSACSVTAAPAAASGAGQLARPGPQESLPQPFHPPLPLLACQHGSHHRHQQHDHRWVDAVDQAWQKEQGEKNVSGVPNRRVTEGTGGSWHKRHLAQACKRSAQRSRSRTYWGIAAERPAPKQQ